MAYVFQTFDKTGKPHSKWRFNYRDWTGKKRTATGKTSKKETEKLAEKLQAEHDDIRKGYRPPPTPKSKEDHSFREIRDDYLSWGKSQGGRGGRGGRPWSKEHAYKRKNQLLWWEEQLSLEM